MFDFLKRDKKPEPIFEVLGIDMHNHMIPGVDDGSESMEMSIDCIRTMWECGFRKMYITPHFSFPRYPNREDDIIRRFEELKKRCAEEGVEMELAGIGGEYQIDDGFAARMENPQFLTVGAEDYLLVELSLRQLRMGFENVIGELLMDGRQVILAHPERYHYLNTKSARFENLKNQGVLFQCNIGSLAGFYGHEAQKRAVEMIEKGWVELLATDLHNYAYADALRTATHNRTVRKILEKYHFMNKHLTEKHTNKL